MRSEPAKLVAWAPTVTKRILPGGFLLVLFGLIAYAYAPSLRHAPRSDHWCYLLITAEYDDFASLVANTWSYSRTRTLSAGDAALFRPLLFVLMAAEKAVFANHFRAWQAAGIAFHFLACGLLFSIFRRIRALSRNTDNPFSAVDLLPYGLTLFFAVNFALIEQVVFSHITGYLLFSVLVLASLRLLLEFVTDAELPRRRETWLLTAIWLLTLAASFTYELGQFCAVCIALFLAAIHVRKHRPQKAVVFFVLFSAIVVIYQSANHLDRWVRRGTFRDDLALADLLGRLPMTGKNLARYLSYSLIQPFLPLHCRCVLQSGRTVLEDQLWQGKVAWDVSAIGCLAVVALGAALASYGMARLIRATGLLYFMLLALGSGTGHVILTVIGRVNLRPESLTCNSHYTYMTLSFLMIAAAVPLLGVDRIKATGWAFRFIVLFLAAGLFVIAILSLNVTRRVNTQAVSYFHPLRALNSALAAFVRQHESEPNFRLAVVRQPHDPDRFILACLMFYHRYLDASRPTHLVALEQGHPTFTSLVDWRSEHPDEEPDCYPDLVCTKPDFFIFHADNRYYAIPQCQFERFLTARDRSTYPLFRDTLPDLFATLAAKP